MNLKHQALIDEFQLTDCPDSSVRQIETIAFRWSHTPINHVWNFLPNILHDRARGRPPRLLDKRGICKTCNLSFFVTEVAARDAYNFVKARLEKKHQPLLGYYTHIASGLIKKSDGWATELKNEHFGFYESTDCNFFVNFLIIGEL